MRVLLAGATGFVGRHIAQALVHGGHEVVGCARQRNAAFRRYPDIGWMKADFAADRNPWDWVPRLAHFDAVINAAGILRVHGANTFEAVHVEGPRALFAACARAGVRKVIQVSALGCDGSAASEYQRTKLRAEGLLQALPLDWVAVRPSLVYGEDSPSSTLFRLLARLPLVPLIGDGMQRLQPIHVDDLSAAVAKLLGPAAPNHMLIELGGPEVVTYREMLGRLREAMGLAPARFLRIPLPIVRLGAFVSDLVGVGPVGKDTLGMLLEGNVARNNATPRLLGHPPRGIEAFLRKAENNNGERNDCDKTYFPL